MHGEPTGVVPAKARLSLVVRAQQAITRRMLSKLLRRRAEPPASPAVMSHVPLLAPAYGLLETALVRGRFLDPRLGELARARVATIHGCPW